MLKLEVGNEKTPIWKLEISELEISSRRNRNWKLEMLKLVMDMALLGHRTVGTAAAVDVHMVVASYCNVRNYCSN